MHRCRRWKGWIIKPRWSGLGQAGVGGSEAHGCNQPNGESRDYQIVETTGMYVTMARENEKKKKKLNKK